jgi:transposase
MLNPRNMTIWLYAKAADMRKSIDTLCALVATEMQQNPSDGSLFLFHSRDGSRLKMLYYEQNCFTLIYRRLERGKYIFPRDRAGHVQITASHFAWLMASDKYARMDAMESREFSIFC